MKKLIFLLMLVLIGCAPAKKVTKAETKLDVKANTEVAKATEQKAVGTTNVNTTSNATEQIKKNVSAAENEKNETETVKTDYDTNKPIVPGTNKPPVLSETRTTNRKVTDKKLTDNSETLYSASEVNNLFANYSRLNQARIDSVTEENSKLKTQNSETETKASYWWRWFLGGMGLMGGVWLGVRFKVWRLI